MKKLLVLLLAMLMAFSFIACDNSGNNSGNDPIVPSQEKTYEIMSIIQETMPLVLRPKDEVEENGDTITVLKDIQNPAGEYVKTIKPGSTGKKVEDGGIFDITYIGVDDIQHSIYFEFEYKNPESPNTSPVFGKVIYDDVHYDLKSLQTN